MRIGELAGRPVLVACAAWLTASSPAAAAALQAHTECRPAGPLVRLPGLVEASGLALGRRNQNRLWALNDSGDPILYALDTNGAPEGRVRVTGARLDDWEALAAGPCGDGSCLYVGDIGDNGAKRRQITIYRVPEPASPTGTVAVADVLHATYPDGAHDAETLLVAVDGRLHVVTKGETGPIALYRFPARVRAGATSRLERVAELSSRADESSRVTDGAVSPDGQWVALRTTARLTFYRASEFFAGSLRPAATIDLATLKEPQGEGISLGDGHIVFLAGEGGGKRQPGTFVRFRCVPRT